jgi:hypothetical protein
LDDIIRGVIVKVYTFLSLITVGLCLAILYQLRNQPGEVVLAPVAIEFEDFEDLQDPADYGLVPPDLAAGL